MKRETFFKDKVIINGMTRTLRFLIGVVNSIRTGRQGDFTILPAGRIITAAESDELGPPLIQVHPIMTTGTKRPFRVVDPPKGNHKLAAAEKAKKSLLAGSNVPIPIHGFAVASRTVRPPFMHFRQHERIETQPGDKPVKII